MLELSYGIQFARRALALLGIFVASCCAVSAQTAEQPQGPPPGAHWRGPGVERELDHLSRILVLTPEQQTQVKALLVAQRQQIEALHTATQANAADSTSETSNREKMQAIHQATDEKISALLNDEQKTKFAAWQQQRQQMMQRRGGGEGSAPAPETQNN
jgi:periplasmic protein CpxP/Spy